MGEGEHLGFQGNGDKRERRRLFYSERGMNIKGEEKGESVIRQIQCSIQLLRGQLTLLRSWHLALGRSGEAIIATGLEVGEAIAGDSEVRHCGTDRWCSTDEDRGCVQHGWVFGGNAARGSAGHKAAMPRNPAGNGIVLRLLLGRRDFRAPVGAPGALAANW